MTTKFSQVIDLLSALYSSVDLRVTPYALARCPVVLLALKSAFRNLHSAIENGPTFL